MDDIKEALFNLLDSIINMDTSLYKDNKNVASFITYGVENNLLQCDHEVDIKKINTLIKHMNRNISDITSFVDFENFFKKNEIDMNIFNLTKFNIPVNEIIQLLKTKNQHELLDVFHKNFLMFYIIVINSIHSDIDNCDDKTKKNYQSLISFFEQDTFHSEILSENVIDFLKLLNNEVHEDKQNNDIFRIFNEILNNSELSTIITKLIHVILLCAKIEKPEISINEMNNEICQYEKSTIKNYIELAKSKLKSDEVKQLLDLVSNFSDMDISKVSNLLGLVSDIDMNNLDINNIGGMLSNLLIKS